MDESSEKRPRTWWVNDQFSFELLQLTMGIECNYILFTRAFSSEKKALFNTCSHILKNLYYHFDDLKITLWEDNLCALFFVGI